MVVIGREQGFLSGLHNNIKYPEQHAGIIGKSKLAHNQRENNELDNLKEMVNRSIEVGAKTKISLLKELQNITNLEDSSKKLNFGIAAHQSRRAEIEVQRDTYTVEKYDAGQKEQSIFEFLTSKKEEHARLSPQLQSGAESRRLEHLANRLKISEIYNEHKTTNIELADKLKTEMLVAYRMSKVGTEESIEAYGEKGIEKTIRFVKGENVDRILDKLYKQSDILGVGDGLKGQSYINPSWYETKLKGRQHRGYKGSKVSHRALQI